MKRKQFFYIWLDIRKRKFSLIQNSFENNMKLFTLLTKIIFNDSPSIFHKLGCIT